MDKVILILSLLRDRIVGFLNKIQKVNSIELDANAFREKMKVFEAGSASEKRTLRRQISRNQVIPKGLTDAKDFQLWNNLLRKFSVKVENFEQDDPFGIGVFILDWWNKTLKKHPEASNIFQNMNEVEIGSTSFQRWKNMFPRWMMLNFSGHPEILLKWGEIEYLCEKGKADYVIQHFNELKIAGCLQDLFNAESISRYAVYASEIETNQLEKYLQSHDDLEGTNIFFFHPLGLSVLANNECSGFIAKHAKEFEFIARNFPDAFRFSANAETEYIQMVNNQLEMNIETPVPFRLINY